MRRAFLEDCFWPSSSANIRTNVKQSQWDTFLVKPVSKKVQITWSLLKVYALVVSYKTESPGIFDQVLSIIAKPL